MKLALLMLLVTFAATGAFAETRAEQQVDAKITSMVKNDRASIQNVCKMTVDYHNVRCLGFLNGDSYIGSCIAEITGESAQCTYVQIGLGQDDDGLQTYDCSCLGGWL